MPTHIQAKETHLQMAIEALYFPGATWIPYWRFFTKTEDGVRAYVRVLVNGDQVSWMFFAIQGSPFSTVATQRCPFRKIIHESCGRTSGRIDFGTGQREEKDLKGVRGQSAMGEWCVSVV